MAALYSDQVTLKLDPAVSPKIELQPSDLMGRVRIARATFTSNSEASGSTIVLTVIPWNARVLMVLLGSDAHGTAVTGTIDDGVTSGRWGSFTTLTAASFQTLYPTTADAALAVLSVEPAASALLKIPLHYVPVVATTAGASMGAAKKMYFEIFYVVD